MQEDPEICFKIEKEVVQMRIAVITLPLHTNYGGLLQAYSLKSVLEGMGHDVTVLDMKEKMPVPKGLRAPFTYVSRMVKRLAKGSGGPEVFREIRFRNELPALSVNTSSFVDRYISPRVIESFNEIAEGEYDAFVVGSDQVWRPLYFNGIENAFLKFADGWNVLRVSYAASFGTDQLEYDYQQLEECSRLLASFNAVSVRESAAVGICAEWFEYDSAVHVLDPVMLQDPAVFVDMVSSMDSHQCKGKVMTYILDPSPQKSHVVEFMKKVSGMDVHDSSVYPYVNDRPVSERVVPSVEQWISDFLDCDFVVTDSFHGCVLAIILHKRFVAVGNNRRGMSRLNSLLSMFDLDQRLVQGIDPEDDGEFFLSDIDWETIDEKLKEYRETSVSFIAEALTRNKI